MVEYTLNPLVPGKQFFRCERMRATLSVDACSGMWRHEAEHADGKHSRCHLCPLGAQHAGEAAPSMSPLKGATICARCHNTARRLIGGHCCISCYNREREVMLGRNAKGTAPVKHCNLSARRIRFTVGGDVRDLALVRSKDTDELVVAALRDSKKQVVFAFNNRPPSAVRQISLW